MSRKIPSISPPRTSRDATLAPPRTSRDATLAPPRPTHDATLPPVRRTTAPPQPPRPRITKGTIARLAVAVLFFTAAPTAGDIGSCGQAPDDLDPQKFFSAKEKQDCEKCLACNITTNACELACEPFLDQSEFPAHCYPLVHDGEVCLHALQASSCADYRQFMNDFTPTIPTECNFCPPCDDGGAPDAAAPDADTDAAAGPTPTYPRCE